MRRCCALMILAIFPVCFGRGADGHRNTTTRPSSHPASPPASQPSSQPSSAPATQFAPLVPSQTLYRVMKGTVTKIDQEKRQLAFHWTDPIAKREMDLNIAIKPDALLQVDYRDVSLNAIRPGRETTLMVKIDLSDDGARQRLTATAVRQVTSQ